MTRVEIDNFEHCKMSRKRWNSKFNLVPLLVAITINSDYIARKETVTTDRAIQ